MTVIDEKYLSEVSKFPSGYAFRGQANSNWKLHSGATRRLIKYYHENITQAPNFSQIYANYHSDVLIKPARTNGFDINDGYRISDLQLLSKLQHFEAATGLLDFTWNPLIALWFACKICTATGNSGHSLRQDCGIISIYLKGVSDGGPNENEETSLPSLKPKLFLRLSAVKVPKQKCVGDITSAMNNFQSGSDSFLKMRRPSLNPLINSLMPLWSGSLNLSNSLDG